MAATSERWVPQNTFAVRLRVMRVEMGLSVEELARRCGVAGATWSAWERGAQPRNLVRVVERIVAETGVDRDWLMFGGDLAAASTRWYFDSAAA